jgi:hypothetical protein
MKILLLDIETTPLQVYTWGLWDQNIARRATPHDGRGRCIGRMELGLI